MWSRVAMVTECWLHECMNLLEANLNPWVNMVTFNYFYFLKLLSISIYVCWKSCPNPIYIFQGKISKVWRIQFFFFSDFIICENHFVGNYIDKQQKSAIHFCYILSLIFRIGLYEKCYFHSAFYEIILLFIIWINKGAFCKFKQYKDKHA
jgi:hypothetical protein